MTSAYPRGCAWYRKAIEVPSLNPRVPRRSLLLVACGITLTPALLGSTPAWAKRPTVVCPPARYLVQPGAPAEPAIGVIVVADSAGVTLEGVCPRIEGTQRARRAGTTLRAQWTRGACAGLSGKVRFKARIDSTCEMLRGKLVAKKYRRRVSAARSRCEDGVADGVEDCPRLEGPAEGLAIDATRFYDDGGFPLPAEIASDDSGAQIVRSQLEVGIVLTAKLGEVNALFAGIDARIASMLRGVAIFGLRFADPASVAALDQVVARLQGDPIVRWVRRAVLPSPTVLPDPLKTPPSLDDPLDNLVYFDHHLAVRAHAAWNARRLAPRPAVPTVVVADFFGGGAVGPAFDVDDVDSDYQVRGARSHGYHVLGIIAATFGPANVSNGAELATGMYPQQIRLRVVDGQPQHRIENQTLINVASATGERTVVNTSLGFPCGNAAAAQVFCTEGHAVTEARIWIEKVRSAGLENKFLHVTSAGNADHPPDTVAQFASEYNAAALLPTVLLGVEPLTNTLVVENVRESLLQPYTPECLSPYSKVGGNIAAIGTEVWSTDAADGGNGRDENGTSQATPQVSGLATYVWSLAPSLTPQEVKSLLLATTRPVTGTSCSGAAGEPAPVIDAYDALLATDGTTLGPTSTPVRHALLDVDADGAGDGDFDEDDLLLFLLGPYFTGYTSAEQPGMPVSPLNPDYSRYDLNGDGYTGGRSRARFDLDPAGSTQYGAAQLSTEVTQDIEGVRRRFDENALSDLDILCYYAYSPLFAAGDPTARREYIGAICNACGAAATPAGLRTAAVGDRRTNALADELCPVVPTVDVNLNSRASIANAKAQIYDGSTDEFVVDGPYVSSTFDLAAPFSGSQSATAALTMSPATASASGNGTLSLTFDGMGRFVGAGGGGSSETTCGGGEGGPDCGGTGAGGQHDLAFEVSGGTVPYAITASVSAGGDGVAIVRLSASGPIPDPFNFNSQSSSGGSQAGSLSPGIYSLHARASGFADGGTAACTFTFTLGPLP